MIISHKYKFIFLKNGKNAGTSFEIMLCNYVIGSSDIVTPISSNDEMLRSRFRYGNNYKTNFYLIKVLINKILRFIHLNFSLFTHYYNHIKLEDIIKQLTPSQKKYTKVMIVRNPYDWIISVYYWRNKNKQNKKNINNFKQWLKNNIISIKTQSSMIEVNSEPIIDFVIHFEKLKKDISLFFNKIGFFENYELPKAKANIRDRDGIKISDFDSEVIDLINNYYHSDFVNFGYKKIEN